MYLGPSSMSLWKEGQDVGKTACSSQVLRLVPFPERKRDLRECLRSSKGCGLSSGAVQCCGLSSGAVRCTHGGAAGWDLLPKASDVGVGLKLPCDGSCLSTSELRAVRDEQDDGAPGQVLRWLKLWGPPASS